MNESLLLAFVTPFYEKKDIMHNLDHIRLVIKAIDSLLSGGKYNVDYEAIIAAAYFHGFVWSDEESICTWLKGQGESDERINFIIQIAWESQRPNKPETMEGMILHDAHIIEGGETFLITKSLITGSVRGQSLKETVEYIEAHVIGKNQCYLPEAVIELEKADKFANEYIKKLKTEVT